MPVTPGPATPRPAAPGLQFSWLGNYGWLLGVLLTACAFYHATPLMPGPLSSAHAGFEKSCGSCHGSGRVVSDAACLRCHATIGTTGSPSRLHRKLNRSCTSCHQEHRSRNYPIRMSEPLSFNHEQTGLVLKKHHQAVSCGACHRSGKPYYSVVKNCAGCHPKWERGAFNHWKTTRVSLLKHEDFACTDCHPGRLYETTPVCTPCHNKVYRQGDPL